MKLRAFVIGLLLIILPPASGQADTMMIEKEFRNVAFAEFAAWAESQKGIHFFYREEWTRQVRISDTTGQNTLASLLETAFQDRDLYYYSGMDGYIIITKHSPIISIIDESGAVQEIEKPKAENLVETKIQAGENPSQEGKTIFYSLNAHVNSEDASSAITLRGQIRTLESGEVIAGAVVYVEDEEKGVISDANGYYIISLERGIHFILFRSMGRREVRYQLEALSSGTLNVDMREQVSKLKGAEIVAENTRNVTRLQLGLDKVSMKTVMELPAVLGEADVIKAALLLPGVQSVGEGASGFNVRGGSTGQNQFLINSAPVFNTSHLFGFFSVFNPDVISSFSLYKSGIPARYGGRLSSIFDVETRTGNRKKFAAKGGISPITGRLMIEGPLIKDKTSFVIGGRTTYSDWLLNRVEDPAIRNSDARFHDLNLRLSHEFNKSNKLDLAAYYSFDYFRLNNDTAYQYSNLNGSLSYMHQFSDKLLSNFSVIYSNYNYDISSNEDPRLAFNLNNEVLYREVKGDFAWYPNHQHKLKFGMNAILYKLKPGTMLGTGDQSLVNDQIMEDEQGIESSIYFSDELKINKRLLVYGGVRLSSFFYLGPKTTYVYEEGLPLEPEHVSEILSYGKGDVIQTYMGPEFRFSLRYIIDRYSSLKLSYNRMRQYLHMISNTTAIAPTDSWKLSDPYIKPQIGDQLALGYYLDLFGNSVETSTELYYKKLNQIVEYKGGASLLMNDMLETDLINGSGRAYGLELMVKKKGRLSGWLSYTYSRIFHLVQGEFPSEQINSGEPYPANHDKPHDFTATGSFKFSRRFAISSNFTYSTGRPITYPVSRYEQRGSILLQYSDRNAYRIPDYIRWDLSATLFGNLRSKKLAHSDFTLSIYNLTGRDNVYSIFFISKDRSTQGYKLSIFNQPIVTLTYNFRL